MSISFFEMGVEAQRPIAKKRPWMAQKSMTLVTEEKLASVINECIAAGRYACDLETTGLDNRVFDGRTKAQIVGVCLSPDGVKGYYIPIRHKKGTEHNIPVTKVERELRRLANSEAVARFHNAKFDCEFLQFAGGEPIGWWDDPKKWEDTLILAWLRNPREKRKGLKHLSKMELGFEMIELKELFPPDYVGDLDFSLLDPSEESVVLYACSDAICTYCLFEVLYPQVIAPGGDKRAGQAVTYNLEKMTLPATRWMERCRVMIDQAKVAELMQLGQQEYFDCMVEVYDFCNGAIGRNIEPGWFQVFRKKFQAEDVDHNINEQIHECRLEAKREMLDALDAKGHFILVNKELGSGEKRGFPEKYDILSRPQLGPLFEELEIPGLRRTEKSKQVQTTQGEIERLDEEHGSKYPFLPKIKRLGELQKALGTYLISLRNDVGPDGTLRIHYQQFGTDTGRFTTPSSSDPRQDGGTKYPMHGTPATYDKSRPQCLLRIRETVVARPGKVIIAADFGGVELRIATNLSGEPKWLKEFFRCSTCGQEFDQGDGVETPVAPPAYCPRCGDDRIGDLHTLTGLAFFGETQMTSKNGKQLRGMAKSSNFALAYGGGPKALVRAAGVPEQDAARHHRTFNSTYTVLKNWWEIVRSFGHKHGFVLTALGRQYPIPDILLPITAKECPDPAQRELNKKFRAKAERNATNGPVQGCLHPDGRIPTSLGLQRIEDLHVLGKEFQVWTGRNWSHARVFSSGPKPVCVTTFDSGRTILTSPDHRFRAWGGTPDLWTWVRQEDLTPDTWVAVNSQQVDLSEPHYTWASETRPQQGHLFDPGQTPHNYKGFEIDGNSPLLWEFLGMVYGDGSIDPEKFVIHIGEAPEHIQTEHDAETYAKALTKRMNDEFGVGAITRIHKRGAEESHKRPMWQLRVHNKAFREFCQCVLGVENQNTYTKRFPSAVWSESVPNRAAFLRGYFSTDGGMSATGDACSVRSVNHGLLQDAQALLHSIGIRASYRPKSLRVSVLDRLKFRKMVGYSIPHKTERLANLKMNPWIGQWYKLPHDLISSIGQIVRRSSVYGTLSNEQKSAVARLRIGSGSKPQCQRYLNMLPDEEIPEWVRLALTYDYEQVVGVEDSGKVVGMYDIEVFDKDHAFVCDGVVVHNSSADITKLAMALIYREVKKREWFEKVFMIITIHDELVFEIDKDILVEAQEVFQDVMTRNRTILRLKWRVPLTTDCEIGYNWTVPYDVKEFRFQRVRRDGMQLNSKGQETGKVWPAELVSLFGARYGYANESPTGGELPPDSPEPSLESSPEPFLEPTTHVLAQPVGPALDRGEVYVFHLKTWGVGTAVKLAEVVLRCQGRGLNPLRVLSPTGENAIGEMSLVYLVNPIQFEAVAEAHGL